jgi:hypothetical protein
VFLDEGDDDLGAIHYATADDEYFRIEGMDQANGVGRPYPKASHLNLLGHAVSHGRSEKERLEIQVAIFGEHALSESGPFS